jgi:hypothetical protein
LGHSATSQKQTKNSTRKHRVSLKTSTKSLAITTSEAQQKLREM